MHAVLENVVRKFSRELNGIDAETSQKHPGEKKYLWDIQEVIEHLVLTYRVSAKDLEVRLAKARVSRRQSRTGLQWVLQLMVLSCGYIPRGAPAMDETRPVAGLFPAMDGEALGALLSKELAALDDLLDQCRRQFGMERVATHPILGPMRVDQWRRFHALHTLHHLQQVLRVRNQVAPNLAQGRVPNVPLTKELQIPAQRSLT
jgi:hypothetical protein